MARKKSETKSSERKESMVRFCFYLPVPDKALLRTIAKERRCTPSDVLRQMIAEHAQENT